MKLILVLLALLLGVWLWRNGRVDHQKERKNAADQAHKRLPQNMVSCDVCGLHLPEADAVRGEHGIYCSQQHLQQAKPW
ncbi:PP0621 family protein [Variovorax sp. HJSM1_2]|uniref:PP0621 family protein n=1 Tax=Variovorax sp. HJSM1_2 TaxID=3366263 RepID=UPI003BE60BD4